MRPFQRCAINQAVVSNAVLRLELLFPAGEAAQAAFAVAWIDISAPHL
jgi:hypothetical protein